MLPMELTMNKGLKIVFAVVMTAVIVALSGVSAFAAQEAPDHKVEDKTVINDKIKAKSGDDITYTLKLGDCTEKLEGIQMYVFYDKAYLELDAKSLSFPSLDGVVKNAAYSDGIAFNWTSATSPVSFKKTKTLMEAKFKAKRPGNTKITYFVTEMYGNDMTYLKSYTFTNDIAHNGKKIIKNEAPLLSTDSALNNKYQGSFVNYADGKGEKNGSGKDHIQVTGVTTKPVLGGTDEPIDVTKGGATPTSTILVILGIVAAVIAIVIVVILRNHFSKKDEEETSSSDKDKK